NGVFDVLEGVFAPEGHIGQAQIGGAHHKIFALCGAVVHGDVVHRPAKLRGDDVAVPQGHLATLPQRLDAVEFGVGDLNVVGVPQGRPAHGGQLTVTNHQAVVVPEGIAQVEK